MDISAILGNYNYGILNLGDSQLCCLREIIKYVCISL